MKTIIALLILLSSAASLYYAINGATHPETDLVYNKANMSRTGIQLLSLLLGMGGVLILLPQTFRLGGAFLIAHSMVTIGCFVATKDWKGGALEFAFLQVPILMICVGYPSALLERARSLLS
ncbi:MAG: hypothetical protein ABW133_19725 [Polyangiaceae bacterium]